MVLYFKFGAEKDMLDLLRNGTIYCNSLSYFAKEHKSGRYDTDELVVKVVTKFDCKTVFYNEQGVKMKIYSTQTKDVVMNPFGNLYCLYSLNIDNVPVNSYHMFHRNMIDFGSHVVIIKNSYEFMRRLVDELGKSGIAHNKNFINYVSMKGFDGEKDFFTKDIAYRHQKEYRIHLETNSTEPYCFSIGSIENIAEIEEVDNIKELSMEGDQLLLYLKHPSKYNISG